MSDGGFSLKARATLQSMIRSQFSRSSQPAEAEFSLGIQDKPSIIVSLDLKAPSEFKLDLEKGKIYRPTT
jgi:protein tyrosine/serine phosphatase